MLFLETFFFVIAVLNFGIGKEKRTRTYSKFNYYENKNYKTWINVNFNAFLTTVNRMGEKTWKAHTEMARSGTFIEVLKKRFL